MLSPGDYQSLLPDLEDVHVVPGRALAEIGAPLTYVYFPIRGIVSLEYVTANGEAAALALVGAEGMIGVGVVLGGQTMMYRAVAHAACAVYRLPARSIKSKIADGGPLRHRLLQFAQCLLLQISQTAICIRHHSLEQQLSRFLLHCLDRMPSNRVALTHELIASMLGVRRQGITESAHRLVALGLVSHCRGVITVLDRTGLLARACECYGVVRAESERLLRSRG